jgi:hypothetical protein
MLIGALEMGLAVEDFWNSTPRATALYARAHTRRADAENRRALAIAWHVAALLRIETLPSLSEILNPPARVTAKHDLERLKREHEAIVAIMEASKK